MVDGLPFGLSVTPSTSNLLVCFPLDHRLNEYDHDGKLIHRINLPAAIAQPWKGIELEPRKWIVCHGGGSRKDGGPPAAGVLHRVCIVDGDRRQVTASHGKEPGSNIDQLDEPMSIFVDPQRRVFIADSHNNRVKVLGSDLRRLQDTLLTGDSPCRLHLSADLLFIGLQNGHVTCYKI